MTRRGTSLRLSGALVLAVAVLTGIVVAAVWAESQARWGAHLDRAERAGILLYGTLRRGGNPPEGVTVTTLTETEQTRADNGEFAALSGLPNPVYVTIVPILPDATGAPGLSLAVVSNGLQYRVSDLVVRGGQRPAETLGQLSRLMARYCSDSWIIARAGAGPWHRAGAPELWSCDAAPPDHRLFASVVGVVVLAVLFTLMANTAAQFSGFARALATRQRFGGPESYDAEGPSELRAIVDAVNTYLEAERDQLAKRAVVLSGVSHDLGTPATRMRLRSALIEDAELRGRFEADIDRMSAIIESALTYTRAELNVEEPRELSLLALVEALVDDYRDLGHPVSLARVEPMILRSGRSLFSSYQGAHEVDAVRRVIVTARPVSIQRAISNLVDNALKYGRVAKLSLEADAERATIIVEDTGGLRSPEELEALIAPFQRGTNAQTVDGIGLGLSIVSTIAMMHGGELRFEAAPQGIRAVFAILR